MNPFLEPSIKNVSQQKQKLSTSIPSFLLQFPTQLNIQSEKTIRSIEQNPDDEIDEDLMKRMDFILQPMNELQDQEASEENQSKQEENLQPTFSINFMQDDNPETNQSLHSPKLTPSDDQEIEVNALYWKDRLKSLMNEDSMKYKTHSYQNQHENPSKKNQLEIDEFLTFTSEQNGKKKNKQGLYKNSLSIVVNIIFKIIIYVISANLKRDVHQKGPKGIKSQKRIQLKRIFPNVVQDIVKQKEFQKKIKKQISVQNITDQDILKWWKTKKIYALDILNSLGSIFQYSKVLQLFGKSQILLEILESKKENQTRDKGILSTNIVPFMTCYNVLYRWRKIFGVILGYTEFNNRNKIGWIIQNALIGYDFRISNLSKLPKKSRISNLSKKKQLSKDPYTLPKEYEDYFSDKDQSLNYYKKKFEHLCNNEIKQYRSLKKAKKEEYMKRLERDRKALKQIREQLGKKKLTDLIKEQEYSTKKEDNEFFFYEMQTCWKISQTKLDPNNSSSSSVNPKDRETLQEFFIRIDQMMRIFSQITFVKGRLNAGDSNQNKIQKTLYEYLVIEDPPKESSEKNTQHEKMEEEKSIKNEEFGENKKVKLEAFIEGIKEEFCEEQIAEEKVLFNDTYEKMDEEKSVREQNAMIEFEKKEKKMMEDNPAPEGGLKIGKKQKIRKLQSKLKRKKYTTKSLLQDCQIQRLEKIS